MPAANARCQPPPLCPRRECRNHIPNILLIGPPDGCSPSSPCTVEHLLRPGSSRRQVSTALIASRMACASPFSCHRDQKLYGAAQAGGRAQHGASRHVGAQRSASGRMGAQVGVSAHACAMEAAGGRAGMERCA
eukprot:358619-Chlamydomonas_euryale.AAC.2